MRSSLMVLGVLCLMLSSCASIPTAQQANEAVLLLRTHSNWAWAAAIVLIWADGKPCCLRPVSTFAPVFFLQCREFHGTAALALSGCLLALAGAGLVFRSRIELGPAWSFLPEADQDAGLVTTGPYRLVRHPIYLGFTLLTLGEALAFGSWPAFLVVLSAIAPTFAWRARAEEILLSRIFGERYATYRRATKMIIPYLL